MGEQNVVARQTIIAMKGHPGTGKSTIAHSIAKILKCPLIDKDHFRDCTKPLQQALMLSSPNTAIHLLNKLSYDAMWHAASTQLELGLNVVVVSPLSRLARFRRLVELGERFGARIVIVECKPKDLGLWRLRVEQRAKFETSSAWHKPATWEDMEKVFEGCCDYDVGDVPKIVVDTTDDQGVEALIPSVLEFVHANCDIRVNI
ncbi:hypothetical protein BC332_05431 [Capsicum chinense]|uniref:Uncharacterized protein n=1 Tax=Capsicum annuum TaxID=4072 RepID=A0A2G3AAM5_CAPAN|nr:hypothetical protein FXO38_01136 [Capsicum annuum]KAF3684995.1 hypothetical protein FXO37_01053 [Capsicum annuum]PHT91296.1 hypothetical protein T459_06409 [Capsicum annuum]PHU27099.1 hypothetical protein BC332_05431 [Capsicum chinense]